MILNFTLIFKVKKRFSLLALSCYLFLPSLVDCSIIWIFLPLSSSSSNSSSQNWIVRHSSCSCQPYQYTGLQYQSIGMRPICVGKVLKRIAGKVIMMIFKNDITNAAGLLQLSAGQEAEAAIHASRDIFCKWRYRRGHSKST